MLPGLYDQCPGLKRCFYLKGQTVVFILVFWHVILIPVLEVATNVLRKIVANVYRVLLVLLSTIFFLVIVKSNHRNEGWPSIL